MRINLLKCCLALFAMTYSILTFAQPENDDCSNAIEIALDGECTEIDLSGWTNSADFVGDFGNSEFACVYDGTAPDGDAWFSFTTGSTVEDNQVTFRSNGNFDDIFGFYTGDCGNLTPYSCYDQGGAGETFLLEVEANTKYYVLVAGYTASDVGSVCIEIEGGEAEFVCDAGEFNPVLANDVNELCGDDTFDMFTDGAEEIPVGYSYWWFFDSSAGGTGGDFDGGSFYAPYPGGTYDSSLNGNSNPSLSGTWIVYGVVLRIVDGAADECDRTTTSITLIFNGPACGEAACDDGIQNGDELGIDCGGETCDACPCDAGDLSEDIAGQEVNLCDGSDFTITWDDNAMFTGGEWGIFFDASLGGEGGLGTEEDASFTLGFVGGGQGSLTLSDLNAFLEGEGVAPLTGTWVISGFVVVGEEVCDITDSSVTVIISGAGCDGGTDPTCDDGIQNGDEEGVDCGGSCDPCPEEATCDDGIQNGDEEGVDCGGSCDPCPEETDPINDDCANAVSISGGDCVEIDLSNWTQDDNSFVDDFAECSNASTAPFGNAWFTYTATADGPIEIMTNATFDDIVGVYTGDCGSLEPFFCRDGPDVPGETFTMEVTGGTTYYIMMAGYTALDKGSVCITVSGDVACEAGDFAADIAGGTFDICDDEDFAILLDGNQDGAFGLTFDDSSGGTGGLAGGFSITGVTGDINVSEINDILIANDLDVLGGTWVITGFIDLAGTACDATDSSITLVFDGPGCSGGGTDPTCDDGVQNGDEDGVDCGGSNCEPCEMGGDECAEGECRASDFAENIAGGSISVCTEDGGGAGLVIGGESYAFAAAAFGGSSSFSGSLVATDSNIACEALSNGDDIAGNIALIDRGECAFVDKVANAEAAGAIAVIVCNNNAGEGPIPMGGDSETGLTAVMISFEDCEVIKADLGSGVTASYSPAEDNSFVFAYDGRQCIPEGGEINLTFDDSQGGEGGVEGGFSITGLSSDAISVNEVNEILLANSLDPLGGTWVVTFSVVVDGEDCDVSASSITVTISCDGEATCSDGVQNGDETGVDCGGSCDPCMDMPTCNDGVQNGDEEGVDCGGSCDPCEDPGPAGCDDTGTSTVTFDMEDCDSDTATGSNGDYSEFTGSVDNADGCSEISVEGGSFYRMNPADYPHSCTEGEDGTAICISSDPDPSCVYNANSPYALKMDITVTPGASGIGTLESISFSELAPETFNWIDGADGVNNPPQAFGITILKNGAVIYNEADIATSSEWTNHTFDFSGNNLFNVSSATTFNIILVPYCIDDNGGEVTAWDLDNIVISAGCPVSVDGGMLSLDDGSTETSICLNSGDTEVTVNLNGEEGSNGTYVITDQEGNILDIGDGPTFDFGGTEAGVCLIWYLSYEDGLLGAEVGANAADLQGCFDLSNPISVTRDIVNGGTLTSDGEITGDMCTGGEVTVSLMGNLGPNSVYVITDTAGNILAFSDSPTISLTEPGTYLIWHLSYAGELVRADIGDNATRIEGCFDLSNPVTVVVGGATEAATISTNDPTDVCLTDGNSNSVEFIVEGGSGSESAWVITDEEGNIIVTGASNPVDFSGAGTGVCLVWYISYSGAIDGLSAGNNAADLDGCFTLSNPIAVNRYSAAGGTIALGDGSTSYSACSGAANGLNVTLTGNEGTSTWVLTDLEGNIVAFVSGPPFNLGGYYGTHLLWHVGSDGPLTGAAVGANASDLSGCFGLSNPIEINIEAPTGPVISTEQNTTDVRLCFSSGDSPVLPIRIDPEDSQGTWVVTTDNGIVTSTSQTPPFDFSNADGVCRIYFYSGNPGDVSVGTDIRGFSQCEGLSNGIRVEKNSAEAGSITFGDGSTSIDICSSESVTRDIDVLVNGADGNNQRLIVTDLDGNIITLPGGSPFSLTNTGLTSCLVWNLSSEGSILGINIGLNIGDLQGCHDLSNPITVNKTSPGSGTLTGPGNDNSINICGNAGSLDFTVTGASGGTYVITDGSGTIVGTSSSSPIDFSQYDGTFFFVYYASGQVTGITLGENISGLGGCFGLSNAVSVSINDEATAATIAGEDGGTEYEICVDGIPDPINVDVTSGDNVVWVVTDANGNILALPAGPPFDFDGAGPGTCLIWALTGSVDNAAVGVNAGDLTGCFALSNPITVVRNEPLADSITFTDGSTTTTFCNGEGSFGINSSGSGSGGAYTWVITDADGNVLEVSDSAPSSVGSGSGSCLIWSVNHFGDFGASAGVNASDFAGCYALSNPLEVIKESVSGGTIDINGDTEITVCVGDGEADSFGVTLNAGTGANSVWVVTDSDGNILDITDTPVFDFEGAGPGVCLIWNLTYTGEISGAEIGNNASDLMGCYALSNPVTVNRVDATPSTADPTKLTYDMDGCISDLFDGTDGDYSDFTSTVMDSEGCTGLEGLGMYRNGDGTHSCTPGVDGGIGMCVSSAMTCSFDEAAPDGIRIDILVTPGANGTGAIGTLSFFEQSPDEFVWIDGVSGPNNPPSLFGVRVMKNGQAIYEQSDLATNSTWTEVSFDFTDDPAFTVTEDCIFTFILMGYCPEDNGGRVSVWDIDNLMVTGACTGVECGGEEPLTDDNDEHGNSDSNLVNDNVNNTINNYNSVATLDIQTNPIENDVNIIVNNELSVDEGLLTIRDAQGKLVVTRNLQLASGMNYATIDLTNQVGGLYYVTLYIGTEKHSKIVMKATK